MSRGVAAGAEDSQAQSQPPLLYIPSHSSVLENALPQPLPSLESASVSSAGAALNSGSQHQQQQRVGGEVNSFVEAFSFVRQTEFYTSPPPAPEPPPPSSRTNSGNDVRSRPQDPRQRGNPVLKYIRNVRWEYGDIVPDYLLGQTTCALYISLHYHLLHPDYLYFRIREIEKDLRLRVVLCLVDLMTSALTTVRHVNKTDILTLGSSFQNIAGILGASRDDLARCPGIGERKVKRLYDAFHEPFRRTTKQLRLDNVLVKRDQGANADANTPVASSTEQSDTTGTIIGVGASESNAGEPKLSVRKALEAAYAKGAKRKTGTRTETSLKDLSTNSRNEPPVNIGSN